MIKPKMLFKHLLCFIHTMTRAHKRNEKTLNKNLLYGIWDPGYGIQDLGYGICSMDYGIWYPGYRIWDMEYGIWDMEYESPLLDSNEGLILLRNDSSCFITVNLVLKTSP